MFRWLMRTPLLMAVLAILASSLVSAPTDGPKESPCHLTLTVPVGATLTVNGVRSEQMTAVRKFVSPPLPIGPTFYYTFEATYTKNGELTTRRKVVPVTAGANVTLNMEEAEAIAVHKPKAVARSPFEPPEQPNPPKPSEPPKKPEIEVPFVPTPDAVVAEMLKLAKVKEGDVVYDLGCGDGRIVIAAVKDFKAKKGLGIDFNPERIKDSKDAAKKAGVEAKLEFRQGDVLKLTEKDFEGVDVVTLYLLPEVNKKLKPILLKGLKPGARVVSHDFDMGDDWEPDQTRRVMDEDGGEHTVYLWTIKKK